MLDQNTVIAFARLVRDGVSIDDALEQSGLPEDVVYNDDSYSDSRDDSESLLIQSENGTGYRLDLVGSDAGPTWELTSFTVVSLD